MSNASEEQIEQQITHALQDIDANFVRAHNVTAGILGSVKGYVKNVSRIHASVQVWRRFFERFNDQVQGDDRDLVCVC